MDQSQEVKGLILELVEAGPQARGCHGKKKKLAALLNSAPRWVMLEWKLLRLDSVWVSVTVDLQAEVELEHAYLEPIGCSRLYTGCSELQPAYTATSLSLRSTFCLWI